MMSKKFIEVTPRMAAIVTDMSVDMARKVKAGRRKNKKIELAYELLALELNAAVESVRRELEKISFVS